MRLELRRLSMLLTLVVCLGAAGAWGFAENADTTAVPANPEAVLSAASSAVDVNGTAVTIAGYNIGGNNYFKLRDIAAAISGTEKQFNLGYDEEKNAVMMEVGQTYVPEGQEIEALQPEVGSPGRIVKTVSDVYVDNIKYELDSYNIDGYNYVKLRAAAALINTALEYRSETNSISILTGRTYAQSEDIYSEEEPPASDGNVVQEEPMQPVIEVTDHDLYSQATINDYSKYFTNFVDGYRIMVPQNMTVDMKHSEFWTVLDSSELRIEVYRQAINGSGDFSSYVNYGNKFVNDASTYTRISSGYTTISGRTAYILEWSRAPLSRISNDKCYYASVDLKISDREVLTFLFKSSKPFAQNGQKSYINMMNTVSVVEKTKTAVNQQTQTVKNSHWNEATAELYSKYFSAGSDLTWGIFEPDAPHNFTQLKKIESRFNTEFKFLLCYTNMTDGLSAMNADLPALKNALANAAAEGRTVELTLQTSATNSGNMLMDCLNGKYDNYLYQYAQIVADSQQPVLFRLCNEMNGDWCVYSAYHTSKDTQLYIEFYKYVYGIFEAKGALKNTIWIWNPNERSFPNYDWNHALCYYPGDEYVDIIGLTGYNTGTYYSGESWRSFAGIYDAFYYQYAAWFSQPFMITEFASSGHGGNKAQWVNDMLSKIEDYDKIKIAIWWDGCDWDAYGNIARSYFIDDNIEVVDIFKSYFSK